VVPSKDSIELCLEKEDVFEEAKRTWRAVKDYCRNRIVAMKRQVTRADVA